MQPVLRATWLLMLLKALNPKTMMGTVISEKQLERIEALVNRKGKGVGKVVAGGQRLTGISSFDGFDFSKGAFFPPTVINNVSTEDDLWREEVFGPVVVVKKFTVSIYIQRTCTADLDLLCRTKLKASSSRTRASMVSVRASGRRIFLVHIALPLRSRPDLCGSIHITEMTRARHGRLLPWCFAS